MNKKPFLIVDNIISYPIHKKVSILNAVLILYKATLDSKKYLPVRVPKELSNYAKALYTSHGFKESLVKTDLTLIPTTFKKDRNLNICLFTGGKDSLCARIKYEAVTRDIKTFHIHGLNQMYPQEISVVERMAKDLDIGIDIISIKLPRLINQIEHPVKNLLTHILAIEYYQKIPQYFTFGFISFEDALLSKEAILGDYTDEEIEELEEDAKLEEEIKYREEDNYTIAQIGSPQISEVIGDGVNLVSYSFDFIYKAYGTRIKNTTGMPNTVETFKYVDQWGFSQKLASCMSLTSFRAVNQNSVNNNSDYTVEVDGKPLLAGSCMFAYNFDTTKNIEYTESLYKKSVHDLQKFTSHGYGMYPFLMYNFKTKELNQIRTWSDIRLDHFIDIDYVGEYECAVCFKCTERYIIQNKKPYKYSSEFVDNCYRLLLNQMADSNNVNNISFTYYLVKELNLNADKLEYLRSLKGSKRLPIKTYNYIKGQIT